ncbi:MAG: tlyC [Rickettsiaceae bacterium]|nr:tlyC [Rickettsiaceae bacterium]
MSNTNYNTAKPKMSEKSSNDDDPGGESNSKNNVLGYHLEQIPLTSKVKGKIARFLNFKSTSSLEDEVAELIEEHSSDKSVDPEERSILHNVIGLRDSKVGDVMIPRTDIIAVENTATLEDIKQVIIDREHTRTPVYKGSLDNVIGFVHIKDLVPLLGTEKEFDINSVTREILYVPPSMKSLDLLVLMRSKRVHMALVLDEYGGTDGLVTMEDLMEEIVGEIEDEHDEIEEEEIRFIDDNTLEINARITVEELEEKLGTQLITDDEDEDFETVGGLIFFMLGHVPEIGEVVKHPSGYDFEVLDADPRRVKKLLVMKSAS